MERPAPHGEKMIVVEIRFWTDGIAKKKGYIVPKVARWKGVVNVCPNKAHGIKPDQPATHFHTAMELPMAVEKALARNGVKMRLSDVAKRRGAVG